MSSTVYRVFVYGTLLRGERNHWRLSSARWLGVARTRAEFELAHLGAFPAMISDGRTAVVGEVYEADAATLDQLDQLEGHPHFYTRTTIRIDDGTEVQTYLLPEEQAQGMPRIDSGDWRQRDADDDPP